MNETIWITRTLPAAHHSAAAFARLGLGAAVAPLLRINPPSDMPPRPEKNAVLVFTSGNGVQGFVELTDKRDWPVVTVGDGTAAKAKVAGFTDIRSAGGTSDDVTALVKAEIPIGASIIHCAGGHVRGSISEDLQAAGYQARRDTYYRSEPVTALPQIELTKLTYIALYSPLAAQTLARFAPDLVTVTTLSISPATDAALGNLKCQSRLIATAPNEAAMLALLAPQRTV